MKRIQKYTGPTLVGTMARAIGNMGNPNRMHSVPMRREVYTPSKSTLAILENQGNKCGVCGRDMTGVKVHLDHNHETGKTREVLCPSCNSLVGRIENGLHIADETRLADLLNYIDRYK